MSVRNKISACIITYKHEAFITDCLEGAINQVVPEGYTYEILIGEDKSPDDTLKICKAYKEKYPRLIKLIERPKNLGMIANWLDTISHCNGKYIALCEGDDVWTDNQKLKKQVGFLDKNEEFSLCGAKVKSLDEKGRSSESGGKKYGEVGLEHILWQNQFTTCTVAFRKKDLVLPPFSNIHKFFTLDWPVWCSLLQQGKGYNFNEVWARYNIHSGGATSGRNRVDTLKNKLEDRLLMMENFPSHKRKIKAYGKKIIIHYLWKSALLHRQYATALGKNRTLVWRFLKN